MGSSAGATYSAAVSPPSPKSTSPEYKPASDPPSATLAGYGSATKRSKHKRGDLKLSVTFELTITGSIAKEPEKVDWTPAELAKPSREGPVVETEAAREKVDSGDSLGFVNQYVFLKNLGGGTSGEVNLARSGTDEKLYAVKILSKSSQKKRVSIGKRGSRIRLSQMDGLFREVAIMKKLDHPNIVNLWEVINDPGIDRLYLVFEYIPNGSVTRILESQSKLSEEQTKRYMRDIVSAIQYCHNMGIVHGDLVSFVFLRLD